MMLARPRASPGGEAYPSAEGRGCRSAPGSGAPWALALGRLLAHSRRSRRRQGRALVGMFAAALRIARVLEVMLQFEDSESRGRLRRRLRR